MARVAFLTNVTKSKRCFGTRLTVKDKWADASISQHNEGLKRFNPPMWKCSHWSGPVGSAQPTGAHPVKGLGDKPTLVTVHPAIHLGTALLNTAKAVPEPPLFAEHQCVLPRQQTTVALVWAQFLVQRRPQLAQAQTTQTQASTGMHPSITTIVNSGKQNSARLSKIVAAITTPFEACLRIVVPSSGHIA
eukprot:6190107-Amphidinium_carterae.1